MRTREVFKKIQKRVLSGHAGYWVLLDPDDFLPEKAVDIACQAQDAGADALLVGGSLLHTDHFDDFVKSIKSKTSFPVILAYR